MKPDMSGFAEELKTLKEKNIIRNRILKERLSSNMITNITSYRLYGRTVRRREIPILRKRE